MFGTLRTILAVMVMAYHLFFLGLLPLGTYAVFGFYMISGYLMTLIMHESYGYAVAGKLAFAINRVLRLYPLYLFAMALSILLIAIVGADHVLSFHPAIFAPESSGDAAHNLLMAFVAWNPNTITPRLVPPAWALSVEIFFYSLIGFGLSKTPARVMIWLALSVIYVGWSFYAGLDWSHRYFPVAAASLPFSIGAVIYFVSRKQIIKFPPLPILALLLINCGIWMFVNSKIFGPILEIGFYINLLLCSALVYSIAVGGRLLETSQQRDRQIGAYSYPIYLLHFQAGIIASVLLAGAPFREMSLAGLAVFGGALAVTLALSHICLRLIDEPVQRIREKVRRGDPAPHLASPPDVGTR